MYYLVLTIQLHSHIGARIIVVPISHTTINYIIILSNRQLLFLIDYF